MPKGRDNKTHKLSRKRKKIPKKITNQATTGDQPTASSSTKQDDETGEEIMVKPSKQLKIEELTKKVQGTDDDSFKSETTDDSDLPSCSRSLNLTESVTDDSIDREESIIQESNPDDPPPASQLTSEIKDEQHKPLSSVSEESHLDDPPPASQLKSKTKDKQNEPLPGVSEDASLDVPSTASQLKSETEKQQHEPQTPSVPEKSNIDSSTTDRQSETKVTKSEAQTSSASGELKLDDSAATSKEQKKMEPAGKLETELDTDGSSTITCSSKERWFSDTGSDKESSDSDGSKGVSLSSGNKESETGSVFSYSASEESGPPSVASVVSSQPLLDIDSRSADQENTSESKGEENVQQNNPNIVVPEFMLKKYKEFSSSSGSDSKNEEV